MGKEVSKTVDKSKVGTTAYYAGLRYGTGWCPPVMFVGEHNPHEYYS